ncbi:MAG TPA: PA2169 family four-helix-bundle protein, partial [Bacteroidales bacterium]|nr:PA2169 family four-helix-bundle protein [Bacteroidales bacterium]
ISMAYDGKRGFADAADAVKDMAMKNSFEHFSDERENYSIQLQQQVIRLGGEAQDNGGPLGALHRKWIEMKAIFTSGDKDAIINACIAGEEAAIKGFREALESTYITGNIREVIREQLRGIENALTRIKAHINTPQTSYR